MNELQKKECEILKDVINVIEKHGLRYYAIGGTCIGAIRHKGFIPWDDDIDIAMPRKDYELFRTKLYKELPPELKKLDGENTERHEFLFMKIHDSSTTFVENYAKDSPDRYTGAFVDIMPVDGFSSSPLSQKYLVKKCMVLQTMNRLSRPTEYGYRKNKGSVKAAFRNVMHSLFRYKIFTDAITKTTGKYDFDASEYVYFTWRSHKFKNKNYKRVFPRKYFDSYVEVPFEDISIRVPSGYKDYLTDDFGDYMKLPPEEKRNSGHNVYICDLEKPCEYYAKLRKEGNI